MFPEGASAVTLFPPAQISCQRTSGGDDSREQMSDPKGSKALFYAFVVSLQPLPLPRLFCFSVFSAFLAGTGVFSGHVRTRSAGVHPAEQEVDPSSHAL